MYGTTNKSFKRVNRIVPPDNRSNETKNVFTVPQIFELNLVTTAKREYTNGILMTRKVSCDCKTIVKISTKEAGSADLGNELTLR
jgi:hypothetical protein